MKQTEQTQQYRLHHLPFMVMWVASFGVAWMLLFLGVVLWNDVKDATPVFREFSNWVYYNARWLDGVLVGAGLGAFLMLVQPWLMRWRYGFVPRFWRLTTFFGALLGGTLFSELMYGSGYYDANGVWTYPTHLIPALVWFSSLTLIQTLALWPVARTAVIYPLAGLSAALIALFMGNVPSGSMNQMNLMLFGTMAQAVFSGALFLWLMRDYRLEAVAKRDEKSKRVVREGLHPISFIGLWTMAHLFGWVGLMALVIIWEQVRYALPFMSDLAYTLFNNYWVSYPLYGLIIGGITAVAQPWLMQQQSGIRPKHWLKLSVPAWTIAGLALMRLMRGDCYYECFDSMQHLWTGLALLLWFGLPPLIQSLALWREMRGAWLYALSGMVSAALAYFLYLQFDWTYSESMYATLFGALAQALLTGAAYLTILAQTRQNQAQEASLETIG
jgi:hypothetical protein